MSWDVYLKDPKTGKTFELKECHNLTGGTYALEGTKEAWLNVTYNYSKKISKVFHKKDGLRYLYGKTARETAPLLLKSCLQLGVEMSSNYWEDTDGNVGRALFNLLVLAVECPDGVWELH